MGPPGSGKGTISERIVRDFQLTHLAAGDVLRKHIAQKTEFGTQIQAIVSSGRLVPSDVLIPVIHSDIKSTLSSPTTTGLLLDGFPRSIEQAESLESVSNPDVAIQLDVPFQTIVDRIKSRWVHAPSGRVYNLEFNPPKSPGKDDVTGEPLMQREDDKPAVVMERLRVYEGVMNPILDYYKSKNVLQIFSGTESNVIYPEVNKFLQQFIQQLSAAKMKN